MDKDLYLQILDFVFACKKLQYLIKKKYVPQSEETLMREFGLKKIPRKGEIESNTEIFSYWIHGAGITYSTKDRDFSHTFYLGKGLDIIFNIREVLKFHRTEVNKSFDSEMNELEDKKLIQKLSEQSETYYLV